MHTCYLPSSIFILQLPSFLGCERYLFGPLLLLVMLLHSPGGPISALHWVLDSLNKRLYHRNFGIRWPDYEPSQTILQGVAITFILIARNAPFRTVTLNNADVSTISLAS